ncbi:MAG: hypothetical protein K6D38_07410 [Pseudobutyrivibrio sp.]|nr:hypothetical protein [Pseudobutyrivibrio sp.]
MKKRLVILICAIAMMFQACGNTTKNEKEPDARVQTVDEEDEEPEEEEDDLLQSEYEGQDPNPDVVSSPAGIDLDLTMLSSTMIYSEVFNMVVSPQDYVGKIIKLEGTCNVYTDPYTDKTYYSCIVQDATQCCSKGLEFVLDDSKYSKEDYPKSGDDVTITGTFTTYEEDGEQYLTIVNSTME